MGPLCRCCQNRHLVALPSDIPQQPLFQSCDVFLDHACFLLWFVGSNGRLGYVSPYGQTVGSEH